jgi:hypothetical protein
MQAKPEWQNPFIALPQSAVWYSVCAPHCCLRALVWPAEEAALQRDVVGRNLVDSGV